MPSRRTVVLCLGAALVTGFGAGAIAGAIRRPDRTSEATTTPPPSKPGTTPPSKPPSTSPTTSAPDTRRAVTYEEVGLAIAPRLKSPVAGHEVVVSVPSWDEKIRDSSPLFRDYEDSGNGDWVRVRVFPAEGNDRLRPREVALRNLDELRNRDKGLKGYQDLGQENLDVKTSDTPVPDKPGYQLRYSFVSPTSDRRRWALERFFGDEDIIYLVAGYASSPERLDGLEPVLDTVIGSLHKTEP